MKGIILAGGTGSRMSPLTHAVSKHLLPVNDKPMIYYPLAVLMIAGIKQILVITSSDHLSAYKSLLGDGAHLGISITYEVQDKPNGVAEAFIIGEKFIGSSNVALILGDNFFYVEGFEKLLKRIAALSSGATVIAKKVKNPTDYGVVEFDDERMVLSIEEKPIDPKSDFALTGLYFYDNNVVKFAKMLKPSVRNELEITDINNLYLKNNKLNVELLGRGAQWFDMGTIGTYHQVNSLVSAIESSKDFKIACIEEIAFRLEYISENQMAKIAEKHHNSEYGKYITSILNYNIKR